MVVSGMYMICDTQSLAIGHGAQGLQKVRCTADCLFVVGSYSYVPMKAPSLCSARAETWGADCLYAVGS